MSDVMRAEFKPLTVRQKELVAGIKIKFNLLHANLESIEKEFGSDRLMSIAKTELESSSMWAVKSITRDLKPIN